MNRIYFAIHSVILYFTIFSINKCYCGSTFNGTIAEKLSISQCINGNRPEKFSWEQYVTTSEFIKEVGYPAEEHVVETEDGYLLTMHRIPGAAGASPVLLQHGLISSSFDWVVSGKDKALAFLLADKGYDVWLGNIRGNTYSRCHTKYTTSDYSFWNFSWHEHGIYDVPAEITYVTKMTNQDIIYVGHSMGTTMFYVMAIERPDIAFRVKAMYSLAPIAYIYYLKSPLRLLSPFTGLLELFTEVTGEAEFLSQDLFVKLVVKYICSPTLLQRKFCTNIIFSGVGFDAAQANYTNLPLRLYHFPAGTSLKTWIHYFQEENSANFQYYSFGFLRNLKAYGSIYPSEYNISKIQVPIGIFWSDNDFFASPIDVQRLYTKLPKKILNYRVDYSQFNHLDFLWAIDAVKYVYSKLLSEMENYR